MNKAVNLVMKALSHPESRLDVQKSRRLMNLKRLDLFRPFYRTLDTKVYHDGHEVPMRIYFPNEESYDTVDLDVFAEQNKGIDQGAMGDNTYPVILYIHGGGFVTESVESYNRVCWNLAKHTKHVVVSVDYPLAPERRFPTQVEDCYAVLQAVLGDRSILNVDSEQITVMGDSAGGNLTAAICQMARDRGGLMPKRQILIYPCTNNDYSLHSPFPSVIENGTDYLLTRQNMVDYLELYAAKDSNWQNPYFAPLLAKDFSGLPRALVITGQYDPLRDEGEAYAKKMKAAGVEVEHHRIADTIHGFMLMEPLYPAVRETYEYINHFFERQ